MRAHRLHLGEEALVYRLAYNGDVVGFKMGGRQGKRVGVLAYRRLRETRFRNVWQGTRSRAIPGSTSDDRVGCRASDGRCAPARPALQCWPINGYDKPFRIRLSAQNEQLLHPASQSGSNMKW